MVQVGSLPPPPVFMIGDIGEQIVSKSQFSPSRRCFPSPTSDHQDEASGRLPLNGLHAARNHILPMVLRRFNCPFIVHLIAPGCGYLYNHPGFHPHPLSLPPMTSVSPATCINVPITPSPDTLSLRSPTFQAPPLDGSVPFPELYDWHYLHSPNHPVYVFPEQIDSGINRSIYWRELVPAIHRAGKLITKLFGIDLPVPADKPPIVAIFSVSGKFQTLYLSMTYSNPRRHLHVLYFKPWNPPDRSYCVSDLTSKLTPSHRAVAAGNRHELRSCGQRRGTL